MRMREIGLLGVAVSAVFLSTAEVLLASVPVVPEIDGASLSLGLGVLAAGALMLRARFRR